MKKNELIGNIVSYAPIIIFFFYGFFSKDPDTGIDWTQVIIAFIIGGVSHSIGNKIKNKGKVE